MTCDQALPTLRTLKRIAHESGPFPITADNLLRTAKREWLDEETAGLLRLFPHNELFHDRKEFIDRCENLELLVRSAAENTLEPVYDRGYKR